MAFLTCSDVCFRRRRTVP